MNEPLLTISLLIIVVCALGVLWLFFRINKRTQDIEQILYSVNHNQTVAANGLSYALEHQRGMQKALLEDGKLTRERITQVKTRLADEERDDQEDKRRQRAQA